MAADDFRDRWRLMTTGPARLMWARMYWQVRASAISGTAKDAADSLGMKEGTYRAYEREAGTSKHIPLDHQAAIRFGRKFGVSWQWLLLGEGTPFDDQLPEAQERMLRAMEAVDRIQQEAMVDMVERLLGQRKAG